MRMSMTLAVSAILLGTPAVAQQVTNAKTSAGKGYLQTSAGAALYVYDNDRTPGGTPGAPTCNDQCATYWPPFTADAASQPKPDWSAVSRKDGSKQWAYKGRPLYTFARDKKPGQVEGDGFNGNKWHLAEP